MTNATPGPRQRRREEKTRALLEDAAAIVVEGGMNALTMPALARRAGVAVGGLYRYFDSKAELIATLQLAAVRDLDAFVGPPAEAGGLQAVRAMVMGVAAFQQAHPTAFLLLDLAVSDPRQILDDASAARVSSAVEPILERVQGHLEEAVQSSEIGPADARQRTLGLWAVVFGVLHLRKMDARRSRANLRHDAILTMVLDDLFRGWSTAR